MLLAHGAYHIMVEHFRERHVGQAIFRTDSVHNSLYTPLDIFVLSSRKQWLLFLDARRKA